MLSVVVGTKMKTCICNKCMKEIGISIHEEILDKDEDGNDIIEQFFVCPECSARYTIFISDKYMRKQIVARKRMKKMAGNYNPALDVKLVEAMQNHFIELKKRYAKE